MHLRTSRDKGVALHLKILTLLISLSLLIFFFILGDRILVIQGPIPKFLNQSECSRGNPRYSSIRNGRKGGPARGRQLLRINCFRIKLFIIFFSVLLSFRF